MIAMFLLVAIACIVTAENSTEQLQLTAVFSPSQVNHRVNSTQCVNISLRGMPEDDQDINKTAFLLLLNADDYDMAVNTTNEFMFDQNWQAEHCIWSRKAGRFNYYVQLKDYENVSIGGSLVVHVYHYREAEIFSTVVGWVYFFLWSISFYPQVVLNQIRRSVVGLSFDFTAINLGGFVPFAIFNCLMYFPGPVQDEYFRLHPHNPIPVEPNDVAFSVHAAALCAITVLQCFIFERGGQHVTLYGYTYLGCSGGAILIAGILCGAKVINLLQFVYVLSYVKLASTAVKFIPQVYFNYRRKSTVGWSIWAIILDMCGGLCSFLQQFVIALNFDSWSVLYGNVVKLLLGLASLVFDVIFILQHYVLYRQPKKE